MKIDDNQKYTLVTPTENSFYEFVNALEIKKSTFEEVNLIINLNDSFDNKERNLHLFIDYAIQKKENGFSFIIVDTTAAIEDYPETFNITPTLQEAEDILEMEDIERALGF